MHGFQGYPARLIPRHMELTWKEVRRAGEYKYNFSNKNLKRQRQSKNYILFQKLVIVQMIFLGGETSLESYAKRPTYTQHSTEKVKYLIFVCMGIIATIIVSTHIILAVLVKTSQQ